MADGGHPAALGLEDVGHPAGGLALAAAGADGADRDHRLGALDHGVFGSEQDEGGSGGLDLAGLVHDVFVGYVAVGEIDLGHVELADEGVELLLGINGDAVRIELAGQDGRILAALNVGNLGCRKRDHLEIRVVPEVGVEIVEIPSGGAHDDDLFHAYDSFVFTKKHINSFDKNRGSIHHPRGKGQDPRKKGNRRGKRGPRRLFRGSSAGRRAQSFNACGNLGSNRGSPSPGEASVKIYWLGFFALFFVSSDRFNHENTGSIHEGTVGPPRESAPPHPSCRGGFGRRRLRHRFSESIFLCLSCIYNWRPSPWPP